MEDQHKLHEGTVTEEDKHFLRERRKVLQYWAPLRQHYH